METIYVILISLGVVGLALGVSYLIKRYKIDTKDYLDGIDVTQMIITLIRSIARDMGVEEELIVKVSHIINSTLEYMRNLPEEFTKDERIIKGFDLAIDLCESFEIELNDDREYILFTLITVGFNLYETLQGEKNRGE